jgi:protein-S-isoprenylcysteine O-methyltransferase Ste14
VIPLPWPAITQVAHLPLGFLLVAVGLALGVVAVLQMYRKGTSPIPEHPTTAIVSDGIFAYTRNPIYLGFTLITVGMSLISNQIWLVVTLIPVLVVMHYGVILREEKYLSAKFGAPYTDYLTRVRRWL